MESRPRAMKAVWHNQRLRDDKTDDRILTLEPRKMRVMKKKKKVECLNASFLPLILVVIKTLARSYLFKSLKCF